MATIFLIIGLGFMNVVLTFGKNSKEATCDERDSCESHLEHDTILRNCGCDQSCVTIGDCCHDYEQQSPLLHLQKLPNFECTPLPMIQGTYNYLLAMVGKCPPEFDNAVIKMRCESILKFLPFTPAKIAKDVLFFVPVVGQISKLLYTNIYCAICNKEHYSFFLNIDIRNRRPMTIKQLSSLKDLNEFDSAFPRSQVVMSHECYNPRPCRSAVKNCSDNWSDEEMRKKCRKEVTSIVYGRKNPVAYKNKYCAYCNHIKDGQLTCKDPRAFNGQASGLKLPPYSLLFDLNTGVISSRESQANDKMLQTGILDQQIQCSEQELYDPFKKQCTSILEIDEDTNNSCVSILNKKMNAFSHHQVELDKNGGNSMKLNCDNFFPHIFRSASPNNTYRSDGVFPYGQMVHHSDFLCITLNESKNDSSVALSQHDTHLANSASYLTFILNVFSILGLTAQIIVYSLFPTLRNTPGKCLICLSTALMISQILFSFVGVTTVWFLCYAIALTLHFSLLSYFSWTSVLSFDIWHTFHVHAKGVVRVNNNDKSVFCNFTICAFGYPFVTVAISVLLDSIDFYVKPDYGKDICWFGQSAGLFYLFVIPVALTIAANAIFLILTIHNIVKASQTTQVARASKSRREQHRFYLYVKLTLVMGVTWIIAFVAMATKRQEVWYLFIILNSLQGVWIFLSFVCTRKVLRLITASWSNKNRK